MNMKRSCLTFLALGVFLADAQAAPEVTAALENLGIPSLARYPEPSWRYARNVWDMQVFNGRVYLGHGNGSNSEPNINAGPVPILYFDPSSGQFVNENNFSVADEQIDVYRIIDGQLYVPGQDAKEDWSFGNFYRLESAGWKKYRTMQNALHVYDIVGYKNQLVAGVGDTPMDFFPVLASTDGGNSWREIKKGAGFFLGRRGVLFELQGLLHSPSIVYGNTMFSAPSHWTQYDGSTATERPDLTFTAVFPQTTVFQSTYTSAGKIARPVNFGGAVAYIGGYYHNDHQMRPYGTYVARSLTPGNLDIEKIPLPANDKPWDLLARPDAVYLLASEKVDGAPDVFINKVYRSADLSAWIEVFRFSQPTFALSFEEIGGDFYFGLGTDIGAGLFYSSLSYTDDLRPESGRVLRVRRSAYAPGGDDAPPAPPRGLRAR